MAWKAIVDTDAQLARVLGVTPPAVRKAEQRGVIKREPDSSWDAFAALEQWRTRIHPLLQRPARAPIFRPWLDPCTPLSGCIWREFVRRAEAAGADIYEDDEDDGATR
jgi:hypothetical protein